MRLMLPGHWRQGKCVIAEGQVMSEGLCWFYLLQSVFIGLAQFLHCDVMSVCTRACELSEGVTAFSNFRASLSGPGMAGAWCWAVQAWQVRDAVTVASVEDCDRITESSVCGSPVNGFILVSELPLGAVKESWREKVIALKHFINWLHFFF